MPICLSAVFFIFTEEYQRLIDEQKMNLYGEKLLRLPLPRYIVLCNAADMEEEKRSSVSDAYRIKGDASLEVQPLSTT